MFKISFIIIILWLVVRLRIKDLTLRTVFLCIFISSFVNHSRNIIYYLLIALFIIPGRVFKIELVLRKLIVEYCKEI